MQILMQAIWFDWLVLWQGIAAVGIAAVVCATA